MKKVYRLIPMPALLLIVVNILILFGASGAGSLGKTLFGLKNGAFTWGDGFLFLGLICLFLEIFKSTRTAQSEIYDHILSTLTFIVYLIEFILVKGAGTSVFLLLTFMSLIDVIAGFTVTISTARRDIALDRDAGFIQPSN